MKRKLYGLLLGAGSLTLTLGWHGMAQAGQPVPPFDGAGPHTASGQQLAAVGGLVPATRSAGDCPPLQDLLPTRAGRRRAAAVAINQDLLAKASFPDSEQAGDVRAQFIKPNWLHGDLERQAGKKRISVKEPGGGIAVSEPLGLFLLGTGMFGLAAFKRRWKR